MKSLQLLLALPARSDRILELAGQAAPSLGKLLRRGRTATHAASLAEMLCRSCGIQQQQDWPLAPVCAAAEGIPNAAKGYWLRLDPVHLEVVMGGLLLRPPTSLQLSPAEAGALIADINLHWQSEGLRVFAVSPTRWYLRLPEAPNLRTTPLDQMDGEYLTPHLPRGADARLFLQRINEVQMLMHTHAVNLAREEAGRPLVNGLWLWGGGRLAAGKTALDLIAADVFEMRALASHAGIASIAQPESLSGMRHCNHALVALTPPETAWDGNLAEHLARLEQAWFQPLLRQLAWGRIRQARLELIGQRAVTLSPGRVWRFWR